MFSSGKKIISGSVLLITALLFIAGCSSPTSGGDSALEAAEAFKTAHAEALEKTADTVSTGDEATVNAALAAYEALGVDAKALLGEEKALLDGLKAKIDELKSGSPAEAAANAFKTAHAGALGKTAATVTIGDETAVDAALAAYEALGADAKALLGTEKTLLDSLKARIDELKDAGLAGEAANAFKTAYAGALGKTTATVTSGDEAAVDAALTAYEALSADAKALLGEEKALLDSLKARIEALKAAEAFKTAYAGALGKTAATVTIGDEADMDAALAAYEALSVDAQALLGTEKALLDSLQAKIDELKDAGLAGEAANAFKAAHAGALGKTTATVTIGDEAGVDVALAAYEALGADAQALLGDAKALLDSLKARIEALKAAADFKAAHAGALGKAPATVTIGDKAGVDAALAAYEALGADTQALLEAEKALLNSLKTRIEALEAAEAFKTAHAGALGKTSATVTSGDAAAVNAALAAYEALGADAQALLGAEKALLDSLKTRIETLKEAEAFKTAHAVALGKTTATVAIADEAAVNVALAAYEALAADVKALMGTEKALLDSLKAKIDELKGGDPAEEAANAFKAVHAVALGKTTATVAIADEAAVNAALAAYETLAADVKALMGAEKALLDSLKAKIDELKSAPGTARVAVTVWVNEDGNLLSNAPASPITISKNSKDTLAIAAAEDLTDIQWSLNGKDIAGQRGNAQEIIFEAASYVPGSYTLGLYAEKPAGVPYLINISFTVVN
jgi:uncharacterized protein YukE